MKNWVNSGNAEKLTYLTYTKKFQEDVIFCKEKGLTVQEIKKVYDISTYTLYKILYLNGKSPTPSQAAVGVDPAEGVEHSDLSPNNNNHHEPPASVWKYNSNRHNIAVLRFKYDEPITEQYVLMKIYAELQGKKPVDLSDKKLIG
jgi:hypothetical protein